MMSYEEIESSAMQELRKLFNPEFINRVDDIVVFHPLDKRQVEAILDLQIAELSLRLTEQGYAIRVDRHARKLLIEKGWDPKFGGRPLRRTLQKELEDPLARLLMEHDWPKETVFTANIRDGKIELCGNAPPYAEELEMRDEELVTY
jgi:ATP-dependent Clp protease ATP-binding subunit ClpC